jgi:hypothetical protein
MPEITFPEVRLPDIKLPEGLRDMTREDIVQAARDVRMPKMELPKVEMPDIDLSKMELPKSITDHLPKRNRANPLLPFAGLVVVGAAIAAIWWLFTSAETGPRVRSAMNDLKARITGQSHDMIRYDQEEDLGSLLSDQSGTSEFGAVAVGPGEESETLSPATH